VITCHAHRFPIFILLKLHCFSELEGWVALLLEGGVLMKRFMVLLALVVFSVPVSMSLAVAGDGPATMTLVKECVLFGRILGNDVMLYPYKQVSEPVYNLPAMTPIQQLEVLNTITGEWHQLTLSEDGYFCANVGMGRYELRGRDHARQPYVIHSFTIPRGMAVNLGEFWIEARDSSVVAREGWFSHVKRAGWQEYRESSGSIALRPPVEHIVSDEAYEDCENWFAECHEDVYDQFSSVIALR
jgi:hypothetical protein